MTSEFTLGASDDEAADERELAEEVIFVVMADVLVCAQSLVVAPVYFFFCECTPEACWNFYLM